MRTPIEITTKEAYTKHTQSSTKHTPPKIIDEIPTEAHEQRKLVEALRRCGLAVFAIPNGGFRNKAEAAKMKHQGVSAGVPDLFIASRPPEDYSCRGVFIEMKRLRKSGSRASMVSPEQAAWHDVLEACGYTVLVCYGAASALDALRKLGFLV